MEHYNVFLSHANVDKLDYVEDLKNSFDKLGISVFYDKEVLKWGDKWKQRIYDGLEHCDFGVIVISGNFFGREWTEKELKTLFSRQHKSGQKIVLPIAHNVSLRDITAHYKKLSDIHFLESAKLDIKDITIQLASVLLEFYKNAPLCAVDDKYTIVSDYCENKMCSSYKFFKWLTKLIEKNEFVAPYDEDWIGWETFRYNDKPIPLFQVSEDGYRINPNYYDTFKKYFDKEITPQMR